MQFLESLEKLFARLQARIPTNLPFAAPELEQYLRNIFWAYSIPDVITTRFAIARMIMELPSHCVRKAPHYFVRAVKKQFANDAAYAEIEKLRESDKADKAATAQKHDDTAVEEPKVITKPHLV